MARTAPLLMIIGFASALTPAVAQAPPPKAVTLREALAVAMEHNPMFQAAQAEVAAREGALKEARSLFFPDLTFTEAATRTNNPVFVFMGKLTQARFTMMDFQLDALNHPDALTNWQTRVEVTAPLFTGGKLLGANRAAHLGVERAEAQVHFARASLAKGVTEAFYGSLLAAEAAKVMAGAVETARSHQTQVEAMHKQGLVLDSDLMRIRVFAADMAQQEASRRADAEVARSYLAYAMGEEGEVAPEGDFAAPAEPMPLLESAQAKASQSRGDLRAAMLQGEQAVQGVSMARADYAPQIGLMAAYEWDTQDWGRTGKNWMAGVQLRLPLFDGGARAGRLQTAKAQEFQAQMASEDLRRKTEVEVREAWLRARAAAERVGVTAGAAGQAKENQRIVALRYQEGMASITDLLDADTALTVAELTRSQAVHDLLVERARLAWATGEVPSGPADKSSIKLEGEVAP